MRKSLMISDALYQRLEMTAQIRGLQTIEQLLEQWQANEDQVRQRAVTVNRIDAIRDRLMATYGEMPDSTDLIREDRER